MQVIHTLTQRMSQRSNGTANPPLPAANYGDYMNIQEVNSMQQQHQQQQQQQQMQSMSSRAGPQVPAQRPANYRHPNLAASQSVPLLSNNKSAANSINNLLNNSSDRMLSVSGKKKCSLCQEELGMQISW